jgi:Fe-S-cluster containining protein
MISSSSMSTGASHTHGYVTVSLDAGIPGGQVIGEAWVPPGPMQLAQLLPVFQAVTDAIVGFAKDAGEKHGKAISCRKGCGACCRQLVPVSATEARRLLDLVEAMPEPRRTQIRTRFARARRQFEAAGLLNELQHPTHLDKAHRLQLGLNYFAQGIPCPFLEEECCSIYADRPLSCREYLVTSPAENCARPTPESVRRVPLPVAPSRALCGLEGGTFGRSQPWAPLILALDWPDTQTHEAPRRTASEWMDSFRQQLSCEPKHDPPNQPRPNSGR